MRVHFSTSKVNAEIAQWKYIFMHEIEFDVYEKKIKVLIW